jgi:spore germination protein
MYRRLSTILFPVAIIALIGAGIWGYQKNQEKNTIMIKAENQYQRAFHDLSFHIDKLNNELGSAIAVNSTSQDFYRKGLVNIWKISSQAQSEINQLPLTWLPFNETEKFLNHISQFSYNTAVRDLNTNPLTPAEKNTLNTLYKHSSDITKQLQGVQNKVLAKNLRWMDAEIALATQKSSLDNSIVDGFRTVDHDVKTNTDMDWGPTMMGLINPTNLSMLSGETFTPEQIKHKAAQFLGTKDESAMQVTENGKGTDANSYSVTLIQPNQTDITQIDFTKKGGNVIFYMEPHAAKSKVLDVAGAKEAALEFLNAHGYKKMKAVNYDEYQNIANLTFAKVQDKVIIYPEKLTVKVALDNGNVVGLQAADYIMEEQKTHKWPPPKINLALARKELSPKFKIQSHSLAVIKNDINKEVLCYEIIGKVNGNSYRV